MSVITPAHAAAYLRHTVGGHTIREIARSENIESSTISRRVHYVEDSRDCPVWSQIWDDISRRYLAPANGAPAGFDFDALLFYLGTDPAECAAALVTAARAPRSSVSILVGRDTNLAPILYRDECLATVSRAAALGLVLVGTARRTPDQGSTRVARLELTGKAFPALEGFTPPPTPPAPQPKRKRVRYGLQTGATLLRQMSNPSQNTNFNFSEEHIALTARMFESAQTDKPRFLKAIAALEMGETITETFKSLILADNGFVATEKALGLPARSAKLVFMIGLDLARDRGFSA